METTTIGISPEAGVLPDDLATIAGPTSPSKPLPPFIVNPPVPTIPLLPVTPPSGITNKPPGPKPTKPKPKPTTPKPEIEYYYGDYYGGDEFGEPDPQMYFEQAGIPAFVYDYYPGDYGSDYTFEDRLNFNVLKDHHHQHKHENSSHHGHGHHHHHHHHHHHNHTTNDTSSSPSSGNQHKPGVVNRIKNDFLFDAEALKAQYNPDGTRKDEVKTSDAIVLSRKKRQAVLPDYTGPELPRFVGILDRRAPDQFRTGGFVPISMLNFGIVSAGTAGKKVAYTYNTKARRAGMMIESAQTTTTDAFLVFPPLLAVLAAAAAVVVVGHSLGDKAEVLQHAPLRWFHSKCNEADVRT